MLALWVMLSSLAWADCSDSGTWTDPGAEVAAGQGELIVTLYGSSQQLVADRSTWKPRLVSEAGQEIPLATASVWPGGYGESQVLLRPTKEVPAGQRWHVELRPKTATEDAVLVGWGDKWLTSRADSMVPQWTGNPVVKKVEITHFGCGPAIWAQLKVPSKDDGATWAEVVVTKQDGQTTMARLPVKEGLVSIGHGMCGGMFGMAPGSYVATMTLVDAAGNRSVESKTVGFEVKR